MTDREKLLEAQKLVREVVDGIPSLNYRDPRGWETISGESKLNLAADWILDALKDLRLV